MLIAMDYDEMYALVGAKVSVVRNSIRMSQEQLGSEVGLSRTSIINIEKGRQKLLLATFCKIADALNVSPTTLLSETLEQAKSIDPNSLEYKLKDLKPSARKQIEEIIGIKEVENAK